MGKRLLLINPVNPNIAGFSINPTTRYPPLGLGIIAALTPPSWDIEIIDENIEPFKYKEADLVGLTAFTASVNRAYEIAGIYRRKGTTTVLGGIHASVVPQEAQAHADTIVIGEAEGIWAGLIADFEAGKLQRTYIGQPIDLKYMPKPRRDLFNSSYLFGLIQSSRGCPMDCEFCSVTAVNGHKYRRRPIGEVLDELETIPQKWIFFTDDDIIGYSNEAVDEAIALFKGMIERKVNKEWFCMASMNFASNEKVLRYAARSGCRMVLLGVEAEADKPLEYLNKTLNLRMGIDGYKEAFRRINRYGIAVIGAFIYGIDGDTPESLRQRTDYILKSGVDIVQKTCLTPLPGTRLFDKLYREGRLIHTNFPTDWNYYTMRRGTYKLSSMKAGELEDAIKDCNRRIYNPLAISRRFIKTLLATRSFITAGWALRGNINYRNIALSR